MRAPFPFNRRTRTILHRATAGLALAIWLTMAAAEICPSFHAWLHGGAVPDDDDCAVVAIALGHVDSATPDVAPIVQVASIEIIPVVEIFVFAPAIKNLPQGRAPPVISAVS